MSAGFDWVTMERDMSDCLVRAAHAWENEHPSEPLGVAALDHLYRETDGAIYLPTLSLIGADAFAALPDDLRWSTADWEDSDVAWVPDDQCAQWQRELTAEACSGSTQLWESTYDAFIDSLIRVCQRARSALTASGAQAIVVLLDGDDHFQETVVRRTLPPAEVRRYFSWYDELAAELARVRSRPIEEQAAYYVSHLDGPSRVVNSERAAAELRGLGRAAVTALLPLLDVNGRAWQAAMLLAEVGRPDDDAIAALTGALTRRQGPDQEWIARALSRLGRLDIVLDHIDRLPLAVVVTAIAAPYTAFRDRSTAPSRLDYRPLEGAIERWPALEADLREELGPGTSYCQITAEEVDEALRGLASPHVVVRRHAVSILGDRLGADVGARVLPRLGQTVRADPDADVRRLAILSLLWWRSDSRGYADVIRAALADPDPRVREAASYWLQEQGMG